MAKKTAERIAEERRRKVMRDRVANLKYYVGSYDTQTGYEDYSEKTYVDDVLYGLGLSLSVDYTGPDGYERFKQYLREHLKQAAL